MSTTKQLPHGDTFHLLVLRDAFESLTSVIEASMGKNGFLAKKLDQDSGDLVGDFGIGLLCDFGRI